MEILANEQQRAFEYVSQKAPRRLRRTSCSLGASHQHTNIMRNNINRYTRTYTSYFEHVARCGKWSMNIGKRMSCLGYFNR